MCSILEAGGGTWDGEGFSGPISGSDMPIGARIIAATQSAAIWGEQATPHEVSERLARHAGKRFDPAVVRELAGVLDGWRDEPGVWIDEMAEASARMAGPGWGEVIGAVELARLFARIADAKSPFTASHSERVAALAAAMATLGGEELGLDPTEVMLAGLLHDLGKLAVPNSILDKDRPLDAGEWGVMRRHPDDSAKVIEAVPGWRELALWAGSHHERLDGKGYHQSLNAGVIPLVGRVLAVADSFDAMTADRPYRAGMPVEEALRRLRAGSGEQFDPVAIGLLERVVRSGAEHTAAPE